MKSTRAVRSDEVVDHVSAIIEGVFAGVAPILAVADELFTRPGPRRAQAADLGAFRPVIFDALGGLDGLVVGAGFIAAPHVLADQELGFQWWTAGPGGDPAQLIISLDPSSDRFLDYTRQSWFTVPRDTGRRHVTGPYVDYLCTDQYSLTFTMPVQPARFAGVVGSDVFVRDLEHLLLPQLSGVPGQAALVNAQGRVVASNSARQATGSLVREMDIPAWWNSGATSVADSGVTLSRCGDSPLALLVVDRSRRGA